MNCLELRGLPLPPSVNKLYFTARGARHLSAAGKVFKHQIKVAILNKLVHHPEFMEGLDDCPLSLGINVYFKTLENKGWSQGKTPDRYKKIDVSNRIKVLEDAISEALHVDDKMFFSLEVTKFQREEEGVDVFICKRKSTDFLIGEI